MCGPENTNRPRGGALAALASPSSFPSAVTGDLAFHTPGCPGSYEATHARWTPSEACRVSGNLTDLQVVIHCSGDMTRKAGDCGMFRQFVLPSTITVCNDDFVELALDKPLSLAVGNDGIIGRRVSLCSRPSCGTQEVVAEGIVGFNFLRPIQSAI
ncbi:hypothetical protein HJFPF1_07717 [Paramyrothecium foliicola]|nr:hypothetical protein HJFPF1_07717 [Paramyrothecium foliicola]